jgi:hypothetical protein
MFTLFGIKCRIVKIYLEDVYDIFFIINGLYISLLHTQYTFLYMFLLHYSNFIKICARRCAQIMTYFFFLLIDINLNHNVILLFLYYVVNFVLIVNIFLALY